MKIARVMFLGVRGIRDATFDLLNPSTGAPHDVVIFTGPPASGKTRALEAIFTAKEAIAPYGPMIAGGPWIQAGGLVSKVALTFYLDEEEQTYAGVTSPLVETEATFYPQRTARLADDGMMALLQRYDHSRKTGKFEYFPATRRLPSHGPFAGLAPLEQRLLRPSKDAHKYSFVVRFLREIEDNAGLAQAFGERLKALSPTCSYERTGRTDGLPRCFRSREGSLLAASELSDSEADAVLLAATAVAIDLGRSIVLIDRPDLYVDAGNTKGFVAGLRGLGADNQLLLASASQALLAAADQALTIHVEAG